MASKKKVPGKPKRAGDKGKTKKDVPVRKAHRARSAPKKEYRRLREGDIIRLTDEHRPIGYGYWILNRDALSGDTSEGEAFNVHIHVPMRREVKRRGK